VLSANIHDDLLKFVTDSLKGRQIALPAPGKKAK
jgi:hypothetical protein